MHRQTSNPSRSSSVVACPRFAVYLKNLVVVLIIALMSFLFTFSVNPFTTVFRAIINQSAIETKRSERSSIELDRTGQSTCPEDRNLRPDHMNDKPSSYNLNTYTYVVHNHTLIYVCIMNSVSAIVAPRYL